jgi:hypothetical protein
MDEKDIPPKIRKDILEHLAMAQYALFYIHFILKKYLETEKRKTTFRTSSKK